MSLRPPHDRIIDALPCEVEEFVKRFSDPVRLPAELLIDAYATNPDPRYLFGPTTPVTAKCPFSETLEIYEDILGIPPFNPERDIYCGYAWDIQRDWGGTRSRYRRCLLVYNEMARHLFRIVDIPNRLGIVDIEATEVIGAFRTLQSSDPDHIQLETNYTSYFFANLLEAIDQNPTERAIREGTFLIYAMNYLAKNIPLFPLQYLFILEIDLLPNGDEKYLDGTPQFPEGAPKHGEGSLEGQPRLCNMLGCPCISKRCTSPEDDVEHFSTTPICSSLRIDPISHQAIAHPDPVSP